MNAKIEYVPMRLRAKGGDAVCAVRAYHLAGTEGRYYISDDQLKRARKRLGLGKDGAVVRDGAPNATKLAALYRNLVVVEEIGW